MVLLEGLPFGSMWFGVRSLVCVGCVLVVELDEVLYPFRFGDGWLATISQTIEKSILNTFWRM